MKFRLVFLFLSGFFVQPLFSQSMLKTPADTAFLAEMVFFPVININLAISFDAADLSPAPYKVYTNADLKRLSAGLKGNNDDAAVYAEMSKAYGYLKKQRESDSVLRKARELYMNKVNLNPGDTGSIRALAKMFVNARQLELADMYYKELIRLNVTDVDAWCGLSGVYLTANDISSASQLMDSAFKYGNNNIAAYCQLAAIEYMKAYHEISKMPDSLAMQLTFDKIVDYSDIRLALADNPRNEAFGLLYDGMKLAAILVEAVIKNQEKLNLHSDSLHFVLSDTAITELKLIEQSMLRASQKTYKNKKFVYECLMFCGMLQNENDKARQHFDTGVKLLPESAAIILEHSMIGIYALNGLYSRALEIQLKLNEAEPVTENFRVTSFLYYNMKDYKESRRFVEKIKQIQPMDIKARLSMAAICLREMNPAQSRSILMEAGMIEPENPEIIFLQAITDIFLNKASSAAYALGYLISKNFRTDDCKRIQERFF